MLQHLAITGFLKATPATEGDDRVIYVEASNEIPDLQGEVVLAKALKESAPYYLRYGNLDLDHITQIGKRDGIRNYHFFEVGVPVAAEVSSDRTFVKGRVYRGDGDACEQANHFWQSITQSNPPQRWFPSIGGAVLAADPPGTGAPGQKRNISKVRWTNIGFSKTPVNIGVPTVSTMPIGAFAKCMTADNEFDLDKALEAGYGTDSATLTDGAALRAQSGSELASYWDFRERMSQDIRAKAVAPPTSSSIALWAVQHYGLSRSTAAEWTERFMADLAHHLKTRSKS